jgi:hypothetical protein
VELNVKGSQNRQKVTYDKIDANVPIDDNRFHIPTAVKAEPTKPMDAADAFPKKKDDKKPATKPPSKP